MDFLVEIALALAGVPCAIGLANLLLVAAQQGRVPDKALVSILIRAHNAEEEIEACVTHALGQIGVAIEVIVLDDGSLDHTGELLATMALREGRFRILAPCATPPAWTQRSHAWSRLAAAARGTHLLFLDASVRLDPHAAAALAGQAARMDAGLVSGVPRQHIRSPGAALTVPMQPLLAAGFLPGGGRAFSRLPRLAAACDELMLVMRKAYDSAGGHAAVRDAAQDSLALARRMRHSGIRTDQVDAAGLAARRVHCVLREAWAGITQSRPAPALRAWLLAAAHLLPLALLPAPRAALALILMAALRIGVAIRARETWWAVPLHPAAMLLLVAAQAKVLARAARTRAMPPRRQVDRLAGAAGP